MDQFFERWDRLSRFLWPRAGQGTADWLTALLIGVLIGVLIILAMALL